MLSFRSRCAQHQFAAAALVERDAHRAADLAAEAAELPSCLPDSFSFAVVDCESSSLDLVRSQLVEVAGAELTGDGRLVSFRSELNSDACAFNEVVHGIDDELLTFGRPAAELAGWVSDLLDGRALVAFRPDLDVALIDRLLAAHHCPVSVPAVFCLGEHAPLLGSYARSLAALAADCHMAAPWPHRAGGDVVTQALLWQRLLTFGRVGGYQLLVPWCGCGPVTLGG